MKIGILTLPFNNNYGGYMQAYALMTVLKRMGHEPTLIMRRFNVQPVSLLSRVKFAIVGLIKSLVWLNLYPIIYSPDSYFQFSGKKMLFFVNKYIQPQTKYIYNEAELIKVCKGNFDSYIVGSDQVWRPNYVRGIIGNLFLDFSKGWNVKRIAYAASFGTEFPEYTEKEKIICKLLIEQFDAVSFREYSGLKVIEEFNWNIKYPFVVLDPTLLLSKEDYDQLIPLANKQVEGKIFCYVLDKSEEAVNTLSIIQKKINKPLSEISGIGNNNSILPSIETWLSSIRDSDFVLTDSFHGTVFSIIFNKPFAVYVNKNRGASRFEDLLSQFGLEDHILCEEFNIKRAYNVDWNIVNKIIQEKAAYSKSFLHNSLI